MSAKDYDDAGSSSSGGGSEAGDEGGFMKTILKKRLLPTGKTEYLVKWKGFGDAAGNNTTWQLEENLACPELIEEFERMWVRVEDQAKEEKGEEGDDNDDVVMVEDDESEGPTCTEVMDSSGGGSESDATTTEETEELNGFDKGLVAEKIIGAASTDHGGLMFLMKWEGSNEADLVPAEQANLACPQVVIRWYEERLVWNDVDAAEYEGVDA